MSQLWSQLKALIWKNYLLKRVHLVDTIVEYLIPIILSAIIILGSYLMKISKSATTDEKNGFLADIIMRSSLPLLAGNCCRFLLNQMLKEKE